jgi:hypothetical protein
MISNKRLLLSVFLISSSILLNCTTVQGFLSPSTSTPAKTATGMPTPTATSTATLKPLPTESELIGTRWTMIYDDLEGEHWEYDIIFRRDRRLELFRPDDDTPNNDNWKLVGKRLTIGMNNAVEIFFREFTDADTIAGTAENEAHEFWDWMAHRNTE